jgi:hypothetical protein
MFILPDMPSENEIKAQLKEKAENYILDQQKELENFERRELKRIIKDTKNLKTKVNLLILLLQKEGSRAAITFCDTLEKFENEINTYRINFAHDCTEENDDGIPIFKDRTGKVWTPVRMKQLLLKIREHKLATKHAYEHFVKK